jgi:hypothetical protein
MLSIRSQSIRAVAILLGSLVCSSATKAQTPALPPVNMGNTTFLDGIAEPGFVAEEIAFVVHDDRLPSTSNHSPPQNPDINTEVALTHLAWISRAHLLGGWPGAETLFSADHVQVGRIGSSWGAGDATIGPILQWPERHIFGMPIYQRAALDFDVPSGTYSRQAPVNIGSHAWDVHPSYTVTAMPYKHVETSWRLHYLWDGRNDSPPISSGAKTEQAGQAVHGNGTLAYEVRKHAYLGLNAYYLRQLTRHQLDGVSVPGLQQIAGIGPGAVVQEGKWFYFANTYHELGARDMPEGNKLTLRVMRVF